MEKEIITLWNEMASKNGLARVQALTPLRKTRLKICIKMLPDLDKWGVAIDQVPKERWRLGENDRKWKANFDWFINTKTPFMTLLENADIKEPEREEKTPSRLNTNVGYKKLDNGVDNETASNKIGDILRGIR